MIFHVRYDATVDHKTSHARLLGRTCTIQKGIYASFPQEANEQPAT